MKDKDIQKLIDKYLEGETSPAEERQLAKELKGSDIPKEWQAIRMMLGELTLGEAEYDEMMKARKASPVRPSVFWRLLIPLAAILLIGFFLFVKPTKEQPVIAEVQQTEAREKPQQASQPEPTSIEKEETAETIPEERVPSKTRTRTYRRKNASLSQEERVPISEEPLPTISDEEEKGKNYPTRNVPDVSEQYLLAAAQAQDIRSRGERLREEVALLIEP